MNQHASLFLFQTSGILRLGPIIYISVQTGLLSSLASDDPFRADAVRSLHEEWIRIRRITNATANHFGACSSPRYWFGLGWGLVLGAARGTPRRAL
jgi:hypothetical protein